jgi:hypothetical protein
MSERDLTERFSPISSTISRKWKCQLILEPHGIQQRWKFIFTLESALRWLSLVTSHPRDCNYALIEKLNALVSHAPGGNGQPEKKVTETTREALIYSPATTGGNGKVSFAGQLAVETMVGMIRADGTEEFGYLVVTRAGRSRKLMSPT